MNLIISNHQVVPSKLTCIPQKIKTQKCVSSASLKIYIVFWFVHQFKFISSLWCVSEAFMETQSIQCIFLSSYIIMNWYGIVFTFMHGVSWRLNPHTHTATQSGAVWFMSSSFITIKNTHTVIWVWSHSPVSHASCNRYNSVCGLYTYVQCNTHTLCYDKITAVTSKYAVLCNTKGSLLWKSV